MPGQYVNYRATRLMMSVLRSCWAVLYLWMMMHASAIVPIPHMRWEKGIFWDSRLPDQLTYQDLFSLIPIAELWILVMIAAVIRCLYVSFRCSLREPPQLGGKPRLDSAIFSVPYVGAFIACWLLSTYITAYQVIIRSQSDATVYFYGQLVMALLFKILVMANFITVWLRVHSSLFFERWEWDHGRITGLNFPDRLNMLFRH